MVTHTSLRGSRATQERTQASWGAAPCRRLPVKPQGWSRKPPSPALGAPQPHGRRALRYSSPWPGSGQGDGLRPLVPSALDACCHSRDGTPGPTKDQGPGLRTQLSQLCSGRPPSRPSYPSTLRGSYSPSRQALGTAGEISPAGLCLPPRAAPGPIKIGVPDLVPPFRHQKHRRTPFELLVTCAPAPSQPRPPLPLSSAACRLVCSSSPTREAPWGPHFPFLSPSTSAPFPSARCGAPSRTPHPVSWAGPSAPSQASLCTGNFPPTTLQVSREPCPSPLLFMLSTPSHRPQPWSPSSCW